MNYRVCTFPFKPLVYCDNNVAYGFHIDIFEDISTLVGLNHSIKCMEYTPFIREFKIGYNESVKSEKFECDIFVGAHNVDSFALQKYQLSQPLLWSGLNILTVHREDYTYSLFGFLSAFSWDLWICIICFVIAYALLYIIVKYFTKEHDTIKQEPMSTLIKKVKTTIHFVLYHFGLVVNSDMYESDVMSTAHIFTKLLGIGFGFFSTMIVSYFTAMTTSQLSNTSQIRQITTLNDIRNSENVIGMPSRYAQIVQSQLNLQKIKLYNWETYDDIDIMIADLINNKVQGLILDTFIVKYYSSIYCQMAYLSNSMFLAYQPIYFKQNVSTDIVNSFSNTLISFLMSNKYTYYIEKYVEAGSSSRCNKPSVPLSLQTKNLAGLFIICSSLAIITLIFALGRYYKHIFSSYYKELKRNREIDIEIH
jgi:hypothetical protein